MSVFGTITATAARIRAGSLSPVALMETTLDRIARLDPELHSFIFIAEDPVASAKAAEAMLARGEAVGALHGVPIGIKDNYFTADMPTAVGTIAPGATFPRRDSACATKESSKQPQTLRAFARADGQERADGLALLFGFGPLLRRHRELAVPVAGLRLEAAARAPAARVFAIAEIAEQVAIAPAPQRRGVAGRAGDSTAYASSASETANPARSPSVAFVCSSLIRSARRPLIRPRVAGEGDRAQRGGGGI